MRSLDFSVDLILPAALKAWELIFLGVKGSQPRDKAGTLTAICEPVV
jgi:hypothetical protein